MMRRNQTFLWVALLLAGVAWGCSDDPKPDPPPVVDAGPDAGPDSGDANSGGEDTGDGQPDVEGDAPDVPVEPGSPVGLDLGPYLEPIAGTTGEARVFQAEGDEDLVDGEGASGRAGDYVLENDLVRFVVEGDARNMSVCPWGGNVIDAALKADGAQGDILGEVCLFLNADQTFRPERFEVLQDGSQGAAVLAVTGRTELLDFLNMRSMIAAIEPALARRFTLPPDGLMPLTMTVYYILRPGESAVRVVTAIRNDGDEQIDLVPAHLIVSGGDGGYFNPLSSLGGFGYENLGLANPEADLLPYLAFVGEGASFAYVPRAREELQADLPIGGAYIVLHGVAAGLLGRTDVINTLLASANSRRNLPGLLHLAPGDVDTVEHQIYAGGGALTTVLDPLYERQGVAFGTLSGRVIDAAGEPVEGAAVSAIDALNRTMNQAHTDADGRYAMRVPVGDYTLRARAAGSPTLDPQPASVAAGGEIGVADIELAAPATLSIRVRTPDGDPVPARLSILCVGPCPNKPTPQEAEVTFHGLPEEFAAIEWIGMSGEAEVHLPAGPYRLVVSRGMEWSLWPGDTLESGGHEVTLEAGQTVQIEAEIARVLDTSGALSADFHVHAAGSPDAAVRNIDRVRSFLTEGVDVIVSTDHDFIADYAPAIEALGARSEIVSIVGSEITTSDLGHFNGFPLIHDPQGRRGGALDWGNGAQGSLPPAEIFAWIRQHPGEQVVQVNHPDSSFMANADVLRGLAYGDPAVMRVNAPDNPDDEDHNGLWSDEFTAMELMNGTNMGRFWAVARWWLTLVGRGHTVTGTAVTDTHRKYRDVMGGVPRSFVFVEDQDTAASFEQDAFVEAVNANAVIGTNGPFFRVEARNADDATAGLGQTLATAGEPVVFDVTIELPEWIDVDRLDVYMNSEDVLTAPGEYVVEPIPPTQSLPIVLTEADLEEVATGTHSHRRYRKTVQVTLDTDTDAYVVFMLSSASGSMYPVLPQRSVRPFAFSNPIFLDADGGGYDNPPLAELASTPAPRRIVRAMEHGDGHDHHHDYGIDRELTRDEILGLRNERVCH